VLFPSQDSCNFFADLCSASCPPPYISAFKIELVCLSEPGIFYIYLSGFTGPMKDVQSRESDVNIGSRVGESLFGYGHDSEKKSSSAEQVPRILRMM